MKTKKVTPKAAATAIEQMLQVMAQNGKVQASQNKSTNEYSLTFVSNGMCATFHLQELKGGAL